jgi:hypothetical protein
MHYHAATLTSRRNSTPCVAPTCALFDQLRQEVATDDALRALSVEVTAGTRGEVWQLQDGLITVAGKVYVP